jgi:hypothetical protein
MASSGTASNISSSSGGPWLGRLAVPGHPVGVLAALRGVVAAELAESLPPCGQRRFPSTVSESASSAGSSSKAKCGYRDLKVAMSSSICFASVNHCCGETAFGGGGAWLAGRSAEKAPELHLLGWWALAARALQ